MPLQSDWKGYPREWEWIGDSTSRLQVFGGWLIYKFGYESCAMCFLHDPDWEWELEPKEVEEEDVGT